MSSFNRQQWSKRGVEEGEEQTKKKKRDEITENSTQLHDLIIVEILSKLPVKSLLQFRCVCKSWCSLISDAHFVKTHLRCMLTENNDYKHYRVIITPDDLLQSCSLYSVMYESSVSVFDYPLHFKDFRHNVWIEGSCNGLLCIQLDLEYLFIWNPSIRKSKRLPDAGLCMGASYMTYGFGYDESILDYKVVGLFYAFSNGRSHVNQAKVYTLRTGTWRRIRDFPCGKPLNSGKFVNKALHWPVRVSTGSNYSWVIVSLDLAKETYEEVSQPTYGDGVCRDCVFDCLYRDGDFNLELGILGGCLCVLCNYHGTHADVWVMKEYGLKDSWTILVSIPYLSRTWFDEYSVPLCISKNGEILLKFGSSLVLNDLKESTLRYPSNCSSGFHAETYVESLVSPSADDELQEYL